jgi:predicted transcriptional regulator of viral defense system
MNQIDALRRIRTFASPVLETRDAAALLQVTPANANMILRRLASQQLITHLTRGRWLANNSINRLALPELISAPYPAYVSLHSALFHHGLIEQIPAVIYAVTLARARRIETPLGTISLHRVPPALFTGFDIDQRSDAKIATPEKALFDTLYLAPARSRLFSRLPEITIPRRFKWTLLREYTSLVKSQSRRAFLAGRIEEIERVAH